MLNPAFRHFVPAVLLMMSMVTHAGEVTISVTDTSGNPVENAVVYLEGSTKPVFTAGQASIEQKNKTFIPLVSVIQAGSYVSFPNRDNVKHHVYSFSPAKVFELKLYSGVPPTPVQFDKAGTVVLGCNIHDSMLAYVQVVDTPYFAKTDSMGKAKITEVPAGQYQLKVWHYALVKENVPSEQPLAIKGSEQVTVKIDIKSKN